MFLSEGRCKLYTKELIFDHIHLYVVVNLLKQNIKNFLQDRSNLYRFYSI